MGLTLNGKKVLERTLLYAQEFVLDADGDSSLTADTDDQLDLRLGGTDIFVFKTTGLDIGAVTNAILVSGTTTSAFKIDADATTGLEITSNCTPTDGIIIAGSTARGINISGAASSAQLYIGGTDILANGEQAIYVNCPGEDGATNAAWFTLGSTVTSGDVTGLRSRVTGNAASGGGNIRGAYTEAFCGASKHVATLQGILAHASVAAGTCTVATTQVIYGIFGTGDSFTGTDVYVGYLKAQTRGTETIGGNYCLLGLENEAVGGVGKQMDSAIRIFATNVSTPYAFGYGIDLSGVAGEIATADIKLSDGSVINDSNGYWGIGTAGPDADLHIDSGTINTAASLLLREGHAARFIRLTTHGDSNMELIWDDGDALHFGVAGASSDVSADTRFVTIMASGKVGIGTTGPTASLVIGDNLGVFGGEAIVAGNSDDVSYLAVGQGASNHTQFKWDYNATPANAIFKVVTFGYNNRMWWDADDMAFQSQSGNKVGIGTTSPGQILDCNAGSGNMIADGYDSHPSFLADKVDPKPMSDVLTKFKQVIPYEYKRIPYVSAEELAEAGIKEFGQEKWEAAFPDGYRDGKLRDCPDEEIKTFIDNLADKLRMERQEWPEYQRLHYSLALDDLADTFPDILSRNKDGDVTGYSLNSYVGLLHACITELVGRVERLETKKGQ